MAVKMKDLNEALIRLCTIHGWPYGCEPGGFYIEELDAGTYGRHNVIILKYDNDGSCGTSKPFGGDYSTKPELLAMLKFACNVDYWNTRSPYNPKARLSMAQVPPG